MKKNLLKGVMAMALMAMSLPMQADGVKWLEKCLDAEHLKMEAKNATTLSFNAGDKSITVSGENLAAQEYKMTLTPDAAIQLTNAQTYIVIEASVNVDGSKKLNKITANGIDYENKGGNLLGFTKTLSNGHTLVVYSIIDNRGKEGDYSLKYRTFLFENESYNATTAEIYLKPSVSGNFTIYNVGFYTLGDILKEYSELASNGWRFAKSQYSELQSFTGNGTNTVKIKTVDATSTLEYNYLRARCLGDMPSSYTTLDLRNMNLATDQTEALGKDAFEGLSFGKILMDADQYKLFPTNNTNVYAAGYRYYAYKDGVAPSDVKEKVDGGGSKGKIYSYTRNFKAGNNSCVLPFDVNASDLTSIGLTAYVFDSYADSKVNFKAANDVIAAGTPLMIKAEKEGLYLIPAAETPNLLSEISCYKEVVDAQGNKFVGSFVNEVPSTYVNRYGLDKTATSFTKMGDEIHTTYYRAFLSLKDATAEAKPIVMTFDGETTGISQVNVEKVADDAYYNLQGVKMNPNNLPHGIYIHQGKKVVK